MCSFSAKGAVLTKRLRPWRPGGSIIFAIFGLALFVPNCKRAATRPLRMNIPMDAAIPLAWVLIIGIATAIVHIGFAIAVLSDAEFLWKHLRRRTFFVGPNFWAFATLVGGVAVVALYWAIHHSTLRLQSAPKAEPEAPSAKPSASGNP